MTRILVTGGAGYVGGVSVDAILAAGHDVVVLDDLTTGPSGGGPDRRHLATRARTPTRLLVSGPLTTERRIDAILHCAARSLVGECIRDPARYYRDNVAGGVALLEAARAAGVERDRVLVDRGGLRRPRRDADPGGRRRSARSTPTARRSGRSRARCAGTARAYGLRSVSLRYFNVAGATDRIGEVHAPRRT